MPMILYAEFTAKPGSESEVGRLISGLAEDVRREPVTQNSPCTGNVTIRVSSSSSSSIWTRLVSKRSAEYGVIFNQRLNGLIEEIESQLTWLTRFDPS